MDGVDLEAYRGELVAYCYRMVGSVADAEDLVQDTMLRAWRARDSYDQGLASVRTWLYRIATNVCLSALRGSARRPLPSGLGGPPSDDPEAALTPAFDIPWLQPFPDARLDVEVRTDMRLALVAAMQILPARQRAVLLLREVLQFSAAEVAEQLEATVPAVNSALQRARAALAGAGVIDVAEPADPAAQEVVRRYARAFEAADVPGLVRMLTHDAVLEMPPVPLWYRGRVDYGRFMRRVFAMRGAGWRTTEVVANGQPALAAYAPVPNGGHRLHTLQVFTVTGGRVARNVVFADPAVFRTFALPEVLPVEKFRDAR